MWKTAWNGACKGRPIYIFTQLFIMNASNRKKSAHTNLKLIYLIKLHLFQYKRFTLAVAWTGTQLNPDTCLLYLRWPGEKDIYWCLSRGRMWKTALTNHHLHRLSFSEGSSVYCFRDSKLHCYQIQTSKLASSFSCETSNSRGCYFKRAASTWLFRQA